MIWGMQRPEIHLNRFRHVLLYGCGIRNSAQRPFDDTDGNPLPFGTKTPASGTTSGLNYRIYATNSNTPDVYHLYGN